MSKLLIVLIVIAVLVVAGQLYLHSRRRKARSLFERLATRLSVAPRGTRIEIMAGHHRVVLDAQVTRDDRPEELRLTLESKLPGAFQLTRAADAALYSECKHGASAAESSLLAGWHVRSEDPEQMVALASDRRVVQLLERLAALGFTRVELAKNKLRALWPDFSWKPGDYRWNGADGDALPNQVRQAAHRLSEFATAAEAPLCWGGTVLHGPRVRTIFTALLLIPLVLMAAGILAILSVYDRYPTVQDGQLLGLMVLAGTALSVIYTAIAYGILRKSIQRGARAALVGFLSFFGFCLGSAGPILWWNGTGPQGPARLVTVQVVRLQEESALSSGKGRFLRELIGEETPIDEWSTTYRAIVRSWRDDSLYGIILNAEQFAALPLENGRLSLTVFPGALGLEWYSGVTVVGSPDQKPLTHYRSLSPDRLVAPDRPCPDVLGQRSASGNLRPNRHGVIGRLCKRHGRCHRPRCRHTLNMALPFVDWDLVVEGDDRTVSGNNLYRVFLVKRGIVRFHDVTIADGRAQGGDGAAGGGRGGGEDYSHGPAPVGPGGGDA